MRRSGSSTPAYQYDLFGNPVEPDPPRDSIVPLDFETHAVRMILIQGRPWWTGADVCRSMCIGNASLAINGQERTRDDGTAYWSGGLDDDEKGLHTVNTLGGPMEMLCVNEMGVYALAFKSRTPEAKRFKRWLSHEVLPSIRRTGGYSLRVADDRVTRTARRLKCDQPTAIKRVENTDFNKATHRRIAEDGGSVRDFAAWHNGGYRGQFGMDTPTLRSRLGIGGTRKTPLDRMGLLPLAQNGHAKALAERIIDESPVEIPLSDQPAILERTAREIVALDMAKLGPDFEFGVVDVAGRGTVIDVVRKQLAAS